MAICIKSIQEIQIMREGGKKLATIFKILTKEAKAGVTLRKLNQISEKIAYKLKAQPAFKNYNEFPASLCASVNETVVHGVPAGYKLKNGDVLGLDFGLLYKGYYTDMAITVGIGKISFKAQDLIKTTKKALYQAIKKVKPNKHIGDIAFSIQSFAEKRGYSVVRALVGHGIGKKLHENLAVPNFGKKGEGEKIIKGMTFTIEPMIVVGQCHVKTGPDRFSVITVDGEISAHFEHTVAVTERGCEILTKQ